MSIHLTGITHLLLRLLAKLLGWLLHGEASLLRLHHAVSVVVAVHRWLLLRLRLRLWVPGHLRLLRLRGHHWIACLLRLRLLTVRVRLTDRSGVELFPIKSFVEQTIQGTAA